MAAHGGTVTGFMGGINQYVWFGPQLGANILIELFRDKTGEVYVNWKYNNETVDMGPFCNKGDCKVKEFIDFLRERMVKEDVASVCHSVFV